MERDQPGRAIVRLLLLSPGEAGAGRAGSAGSDSRCPRTSAQLPEDADVILLMAVFWVAPNDMGARARGEAVSDEHELLPTRWADPERPYSSALDDCLAVFARR